MTAAPIRALVVDDEEPARVELVARLAERGGVEVLAECDGGASAIELIRSLEPDVVFLDIQMPEVSGIEVAEAVEELPSAIVFTTAFDHFAVRAFELGSLDYLLKPIDPERLDVALRRVAERPARSPRPTLGRFLREPPEDTFVFHASGSIVVLEFADVLFVEARGNYMHVHSHFGGKDRSWLHRSTIKDMEERLAPRGFVRVHRSYLLNRAHLIEVRSRGRGFEALLSNGATLPVSRSLRGRLRDLKR